MRKINAPTEPSWDAMPTSVQTEHQIARIKMVIAGIGMLVAAFWFLLQLEPIRWILVSSVGIFGSWMIFNIVIFVFLTEQKYVASIAAITTALDIVVIASLDIVVLVQAPFNFVNGPHIALYFVVISASAIRHNSKLVLQTGIACGIVHLLISFGNYAINHIPFVFLVETTTALQLNWMFPNEVLISLAMAVFGLVVGHSTKELMSSENHYLDLFENIPDGVLIASSRMQILASNRKFQQMVGSSAQQLRGKPLANFLGERTSSHSLRMDMESLRYSLFTQLYSRDGVIPVQVTQTPIDWGGQKCLELSIRDMSETFELELQLARTQKVQTVGKLAGGLAHDFNNLLAGIFGSVSLSKRLIQKMKPSKKNELYTRYFDTISDCGQTASKILDRLSTFSRSSIVETSTVDILEILDETVSIISNTLPPNVSISIEDTHSLAAKADKTSLMQALLNLYINARDAIGTKNSGTIRLSATSVLANEIPRKFSLDQDVDYICIKVTDDGPGMDKDTQTKIFDPFFTTKESGQGTGIGLSMVYNVAIGHGGAIDVESKKGEGTTFRLYIEATRDSLVPL